MRFVLVVLVSLACSAEAERPEGDGELDPGGADDPTDPGGDRPDGGTFFLTLDHGAFPPTSAYPSALVYVPAGFDATPPIGLVVYIHGWYNCVKNAVLDDGEPCRAGGPARSGAGLRRQLEASGRNAILLAPEVAFDRASGNPGRLGNANGFRELVAEVLDQMAPTLGRFTVEDVGYVVLLSHSGAYIAAAAVATRGGIRVDELFLLDSLYGETDAFDAWVMDDLPGILGGTRRFGDVYTAGGGTLEESQAMADRASDWVDATALVDDRTVAPWTSDAPFLHGLLFKRTDVSHADCPRVFAEPFLRTSGL